MHSYDYLLLLAFFAIVLLPAPWLGRFYFKVMEGQRTWLSPLHRAQERGCYRVAGVRADQEQSWKQYTLALLAFNLAGQMLRVQWQVALQQQHGEQQQEPGQVAVSYTHLTLPTN